MAGTSLADKLNSQMEDDLSHPLVVAVPGWLGFGPTIIWIVVGISAGLLVHVVFGVGSQILMQGVGVAIAILVGSVYRDRKARHDPSQPGGLYVVIGTTKKDLVVVDRPLWSMRGSTVGAQVPFERIAAIHSEEKRFPKTTIVTFSARDGRDWRYELQKWEELRAALPARLRP